MGMLLESTQKAVSRVQEQLGGHGGGRGGLREAARPSRQRRRRRRGPRGEAPPKRGSSAMAGPRPHASRSPFRVPAERLWASPPKQPPGGCPLRCPRPPPSALRAAAAAARSCLHSSACLWGQRKARARAGWGWGEGALPRGWSLGRGKRGRAAHGAMRGGSCAHQQCCQLPDSGAESIRAG